jgi:hypothetical protein
MRKHPCLSEENFASESCKEEQLVLEKLPFQIKNRVDQLSNRFSERLPKNHVSLVLVTKFFLSTEFLGFCENFLDDRDKAEHSNHIQGLRIFWDYKQQESHISRLSCSAQKMNYAWECAVVVILFQGIGNTIETFILDLNA